MLIHCIKSGKDNIYLEIEKYVNRKMKVLCLSKDLFNIHVDGKKFFLLSELFISILNKLKIKDFSFMRVKRDILSIESDAFDVLNVKVDSLIFPVSNINIHFLDKNGSSGYLMRLVHEHSVVQIWCDLLGDVYYFDASDAIFVNDKRYVDISDCFNIDSYTYTTFLGKFIGYFCKKNNTFNTASNVPVFLKSNQVDNDFYFDIGELKLYNGVLLDFDFWSLIFNAKNEKYNYKLSDSFCNDFQIFINHCRKYYKSFVRDYSFKLIQVLMLVDNIMLFSLLFWGSNDVLYSTFSKINLENYIHLILNCVNKCFGLYTKINKKEFTQFCYLMWKFDRSLSLINFKIKYNNNISYNKDSFITLSDGSVFLISSNSLARILSSFVHTGFKVIAPMENEDIMCLSYTFDQETSIKCFDYIVKTKDIYIHCLRSGNYILSLGKIKILFDKMDDFYVLDARLNKNNNDVQVDREVVDITDLLPHVKIENNTFLNNIFDKFKYTSGDLVSNLDIIAIDNKFTLEKVRFLSGFIVDHNSSQIFLYVFPTVYDLYKKLQYNYSYHELLNLSKKVLLHNGINSNQNISKFDEDSILKTFKNLSNSELVKLCISLIYLDRYLRSFYLV